MLHLYRIAICKKEGCRNVIDQSYHGRVDGSGDPLTFPALGAVELRCPVCGTLSSYSDQDLQADIRDLPPMSDSCSG